MSESQLQRLRAWSPHFARRLERYPEERTWLLRELALSVDWESAHLEALWRTLCPQEPTGCSTEALGRLQRMRQRVSLRVAARETAGLAPVETSLREMTLLAEFCLRKLGSWLYPALIERHGAPINEDTGQPCRWCVMALGKLGGGELNFCSDLDLIYVVDGHGHCWRGGARGSWDSGQFFGRFFRDLSSKLTQQTPHRQLYRVDLRLRPDGEGGPLVRSLQGLSGHYWSEGQLWERLAWIKARAVAGDASLASEIIEEMNPFRYPRSLTGHLLAEVAGLKARTEREVVGAASLAADIKSGPGGIREIEYLVQARQLLEGGHNPFLQTHATLNAIGQLNRYALLERGEAEELAVAYRFLRTVENRLQMRHDSPVHQLPEEPEVRVALAESLGFESVGAFEERLSHHRGYVQARYNLRFEAQPDEMALQSWSAFLGGQEPEPCIRGRLKRWFPLSKDVPQRLRNFVLGEAQHLITREQVRAFLALSAQWDTLLPTLARPLRSLERVGDFAGHYGSRRLFFQSGCDPALLRVLCLLFDRSRFIHRLFCWHPEMVDELMAEAARRQKNREELRREIDLLPRGWDFPRLLWLYVKAEQVRLAMGELLYALQPQQTTQSLTDLADAAVCAALAEADPKGELAVVAAGKYGSGELTPGSDLDVVIWGRRERLDACRVRVRNFLRLLSYKSPLGPTFEIDQRLRPYGVDGPLVVTPEAFQQYHVGTASQPWERQILCRMRAVGGNPDLCAAFEQQRDHLLYAGHTLPTAQDMLAMRRKIEVQAAPRAHLSFKSGPGGLVDIDFAAQWLQMKHGRSHPQLRVPNSRKILRTASEIGCLHPEVAEDLLCDHAFLRMIELNLRRMNFTGVNRLPEGEVDRRCLSHWMGYADFTAFLEALQRAMARVRKHFHAILEM